MTHTVYILPSGGMVLNPSYFGTMGHHNTMIHEMGHILGLYHVFKGVSERDSCDDPCQVGLLNLSLVMILNATFCVTRFLMKKCINVYCCASYNILYECISSTIKSMLAMYFT